MRKILLFFFIIFSLTLSSNSTPSYAATSLPYTVESKHDMGTNIKIVSVDDQGQKKFGVVSAEKIVVPIVYKSIKAGTDGFILQDDKLRFSFVDISGTLQIPPLYSGMKQLGNSTILRCQTKHNPIILITSKGKVIAENCHSISWDRTIPIICENVKTGYIAFGIHGEAITPPNMPFLEYDYSSETVYAPQLIDGSIKVSYFSPDGTVIIPTSYDFAQFLKEMNFFLTEIKKDTVTYYGAVDHTGKVLIPAEYNELTKIAYNIYQFKNNTRTLIASMKKDILKITPKE